MSEDRMKKAVVLLSGGLDSTTCLSVAMKEGYEVFPLSFDYSQRHTRELESVKKIIEYYNIDTHKLIKIENTGGSALTDMNIDVPDYDETNKIPVTYVPARNIIFLAYAAGYAEAIEADTIFIGVNAIDYSGYPDCRPEFISAFEEVLRVGTKKGCEGSKIKIETPLINMTKAEIIKLAVKNNVPLNLTTSCYKGGELACGVCDSCTLRLKGFKETGLKDMIEYENK